jgi:hypothetical protein
MMWIGIAFDGDSYEGADSKIAELTRAQVEKSKGVFNSLDGRLLRHYLN